MRQRQKGQAVVEFALVSTLLLVFILGIIDISWLLTTRTQSYQAARAGARYAATHPTAWSNVANPASNTIEGQVRRNLTTVNLPNDDAHIAISYWVPGAGAAETRCGRYVASSNSFVADTGYTQATCLVPGTLIQVTTTYSYGFITPLLKATFPGPTVTTSGLVMEEI